MAACKNDSDDLFLCLFTSAFCQIGMQCMTDIAGILYDQLKIGISKIIDYKSTKSTFNLVTNSFFEI